MFGGLFNRSKQPKPGSRRHAENTLRELKAQAFEAYKLARRDRPREHHQPHSYSGDAAIMGSQDLMHRRVRDIVRNTAQGKKIVRKLTNLIVGTGMQTFAWPFSPADMLDVIGELETMQSGELGPRLRYALESDDLFEQYCCDKKQFDVEGRLSGPEMFRMILSESITVGNGLMVRVFRKKFNPDSEIIPMAWQMFEREQLDLSQDREASEGHNKIVNGIEFDRDNIAIAYHLFLDHPNDYFGVSQSNYQGAGISSSLGGRAVRVPAERVVDLALYDRPSSSVAASFMDAGGQSMWDRDNYFESELRTAAVESVFLLVAKLTDGHKYNGDWGFSDGEDDSDEHGNREFKVGHSPVAATIGTDEELEMVKPTRPNRDAGPFVKLIDRDIASSVALSYFDLTGDYEGSSFTSTRGAKLDQEVDLAPLQQWFGCTVALPVRKAFNALAAASGKITSVSPSEFNRNVSTYQRFDVVGAGRDLLDPFKEGEARTARLRTKLSTYKEECARRGRHWIRELTQHAIEQRVFELFDVHPDFTKSGSGQQQGQQAAPLEDQAEAIADRVAMLLEERQ